LFILFYFYGIFNYFIHKYIQVQVVNYRFIKLMYGIILHIVLLGDMGDNQTQREDFSIRFVISFSYDDNFKDE